MLYLIVEEEFRNFPWCQRSLRGLWEESRKKRTALQEIARMEEIPARDREAGALLLGASEDWIRRQVQCAERQNVHPIALTNRQPAPQDGPLSSVMMDIRDSMRLAVGYLQSLGCTRLALYGCNPYATSDPWREEVFRHLLGEQARVFHNRDSLRSAFEAFWEEHSAFDGVICASDYAALSLVRRLQEQGVALPEELYVMGYGDLFLSRMSDPSITSISDDYEHFGRAALSIYQLVVKEKTISSVNILLHSRLHIRQSTGGRPYGERGAGEKRDPQPSRNPFFQDREISEMAKLETLLNQCDELDLEVMHLLLQGATYAAIAERCFASETAVKYRIKKMEKMCGVPNREELAAFLKKFF